MRSLKVSSGSVQGSINGDIDIVQDSIMVLSMKK